MTCTCDMHGRGNAAHCRTCCLTFSGTWAFDQHIVRAEHRTPASRELVEVRPGVYGRAADASARSFIRKVRADGNCD